VTQQVEVLEVGARRHQEGTSCTAPAPPDRHETWRTVLTSEGDLDFEAFVAARGPALVRMARGLLRDPHHAEDLVQDVLAKALLKWGRIASADNPDAYVRRMVVNASTSWWRRAVRREHAREHAKLPDRGVSDASGSIVERDRMLALLRRLPTKQRAVLVLRHYEGMRDADIGELLGCSEVTVRSNAHRGLATLRRLLDEDGVAVSPQGGTR
jgi:RNA polymerase sigma-70 factor (sigma-E family)